MLQRKIKASRRYKTKEMLSKKRHSKERNIEKVKGEEDGSSESQRNQSSMEFSFRFQFDHIPIEVSPMIYDMMI